MQPIIHFWSVDTGTVGTTVETDSFPATGDVRFNVKLLPKGDFFGNVAVNLNTFNLHLLEIPYGHQADLLVTIVNWSDGQNVPVGNWYVEGFSSENPFSNLDNNQVIWPPIQLGEQQLSPVILLVKIYVTNLRPESRQDELMGMVQPPLFNDLRNFATATQTDITFDLSSPPTAENDIDSVGAQMDVSAPQSPSVNVSLTDVDENHNEPVGDASLIQPEKATCQDNSSEDEAIKANDFSQPQHEQESTATEFDQFQSRADNVDIVTMERTVETENATGDTIIIAIPNEESNNKTNIPTDIDVTSVDNQIVDSAPRSSNVQSEEVEESHCELVEDERQIQTDKATEQVEIIDISDDETNETTDVSQSPPSNQQQSTATELDPLQFSATQQFPDSQPPVKKAKMSPSPTAFVDLISVEPTRTENVNGDTITIAIPTKETNSKPKVCSVGVQFETQQTSNETRSNPLLIIGNGPNQPRVVLNTPESAEVSIQIPPDIHQQPIPPTVALNQPTSDSSASAVILPQFNIQVSQVDQGNRQINIGAAAQQPNAHGRVIHPNWNGHVESNFCLISVDDIVFPVNTAILSNRSEYFRALLSTDSVAIQNGMVVVPFKDEVLLELLQFLYRWPFTPNMPVVAKELAEAAKFHELPELLLICEKELATQLSFDTLTRITDIADRLQANLLMRSCFETLKKLLKKLNKERKVELWLNLQPINLANAILYAQLITFTNSKAKSPRFPQFHFRG